MKIFLKNLSIIPRWVIFTLDMLIVFISFLLATLIRFNFDFIPFQESLSSRTIGVVMITYLLSILIFRPFIGIVRYTHTRDIFIVLKVVVLANVLLVLNNYFFFLINDKTLLASSVIVITGLFTATLLSGYRFFVKEFFDYAKRSVTKRKQVVIYGAGIAGRATADLIESNHLKYELLFFVDDDPKKGNTRIHGKNVIFTGNELRQTLKEANIDELIIASQKITNEKKRTAIELCLELGISVKQVPSVAKWVGGHLSQKQIKDVRIEDLLGRKQISVASSNAVNEFSGKVILVTGSAGSIGSEISKQLIRCGPMKLLLLDQAESGLYDLMNDLNAEKSNLKFVESIVCDITNKSLLERVFVAHKPDIVFHAAAYKHVPLMEDHPFEAINTNIFGTKILADLSVEFGVSKFVFVSTDKAVNPTNIMGATKRAAEMYIQSYTHVSKTDFITTRFGNVLGSNGSVIPLFRKQIAKGGPLTVTHPEITRYFMTIPEACSLVLEAGSIAQGGEIFVFDMGKSVKIIDLAYKMLALAGLEPGKDIEIIFTGLRPGEKLYEELLSTKENTKPTHHPKIMVADVQENDHEYVNYMVLSIKESFDKGGEIDMIRQLKSLIPEFKSNVSRFSSLD